MKTTSHERDAWEAHQLQRPMRLYSIKKGRASSVEQGPRSVVRTALRSWALQNKDACEFVGRKTMLLFNRCRGVRGVSTDGGIDAYISSLVRRETLILIAILKLSSSLLLVGHPNDLSQFPYIAAHAAPALAIP